MAASRSTATKGDLFLADAGRLPFAYRTGPHDCRRATPSSTADRVRMRPDERSPTTRARTWPSGPTVRLRCTAVRARPFAHGGPSERTANAAVTHLRQQRCQLVAPHPRGRAL